MVSLGPGDCTARGGALAVPVILLTGSSVPAVLVFGAMRARGLVFSRCFSALLVAGLVLSALSAPAASTDVESDLPEPDTAWFEGAKGFANGLAQAEATNQPVLVYFYTDWCGYCRQLESRLLETPGVEDYTQYLVKIRINPERGAYERQLAGRYGVAGYPSVFVHRPGSPRPQKVGRMIVERGKRRLMTPAEFVDMLTSATGSTFGTS